MTDDTLRAALRDVGRRWKASGVYDAMMDEATAAALAASATDEGRWPRQEEFEQAIGDGLNTQFVADIIEPLESGEIMLIARHLAIRCALLVRDARLAASAPDEGPTYATLTSDGETTHYVGRPAVPALDVVGMRRAWPETGLDFFMPSENRWVSAVEAMDIFAREYAALQEQTDDR